eukprot:TRINITY_DN305_c4_g1_i2.p1 TRINITY_DN305_c4_g1~~TRINITY_DN305_c4_g1_i2.p1  ORF type:complete len:1223 (+),score=346.10 TRINITY_DN305_c4_g1_i2:455-3670(+)
MSNTRRFIASSLRRYADQLENNGDITTTVNNLHWPSQLPDPSQFQYQKPINDRQMLLDIPYVSHCVRSSIIPRFLLYDPSAPPPANLQQWQEWNRRLAQARRGQVQESRTSSGSDTGAPQGSNGAAGAAGQHVIRHRTNTPASIVSSTSFEMSQVAPLPLVTKSTADQLKKEGTMSRHEFINNILSDALPPSNSDEYKHCVRVYDHFVKGFKTVKRLEIQFASLTAAEYPSTLETSFLASFYFPKNNFSKSIELSVMDSVESAIELLLRKTHNTLFAEKDAGDFLLKISGQECYLHDNMLFGMLEHVRESLQRNDSVSFSLVYRADVVQRYEERDAAENYKRGVAISGFEDVDESVKKETQNTVEVSKLDYDLRIRVVSLDNLLSGNVPVMADISFQPDQRTFLHVEAMLYLGDQKLFTRSFAKSDYGVWDEWLEFPLKLNQIPRYARICFVASVMKGVKQVKRKIGWVNVQLFDHRGYLLSGIHELALWSLTPANPLGTPAQNRTDPDGVKIVLGFPEYTGDAAVVFPSLASLLKRSHHNTSEQGEPYSPMLEQVLAKDPMHTLSANEREMVWNHRKLLTARPAALSKLLLSVDWCNPAMSREAIALIGQWLPLEPLDALELLDVRFAIPEVRTYAVRCLQGICDADLADFLLQLVQAVKYEPYHDCDLSRFLICRALQNRQLIGHEFFWHLKAELSFPEVGERYALLINTFLRCNGNHLQELWHEKMVMDELRRIALIVKSKKKDRTKTLHKALREFSFPKDMLLPSDSRISLMGLDVQQCKYLGSFTVPLWLVFKNADPHAPPKRMIFKAGDDLRTDCLTLQMFRLMDKLWKKAGLDLHMSPYRCVSTDVMSGLIEVVPNSKTAAQIQKEDSGVTAALRKTPLSRWLREHNPTDAAYAKAVDNFVRSCAGYCVATYVLGIGDRHNDNIMITKSGHLFHIDFAKILGNWQTWQGIKRERAPFVLTPEFVYVMGKKKSEHFQKFVDTCCSAYNVIRKHAHLIINLFLMMLGAGIPELQEVEHVHYLRESFHLELSDEEASKLFVSLIEESMDSKSTSINFLIHNLAQEMK